VKSVVVSVPGETKGVSEKIEERKTCWEELGLKHPSGIMEKRKTCWENLFKKYELMESDGIEFEMNELGKQSSKIIMLRLLRRG